MQSTFTQQYLYAGDISETNNLWVYKIDAQTGIPTMLPWSPLKTVNNPHSGTTDPKGEFLYVGEDNTESSTLDRIVEAYRLPSDDSPPTRIGYVDSGYPAIVAFDPQGKFLYVEEPLGGIHSVGATSWVRSFAIAGNGMPVKAAEPMPVEPRYASGFGFKADGNYAFVSRHPGGSGGKPPAGLEGVPMGQIYVYRQNCGDGSLTKVSEVAANQGLRFIEVPRLGPVLIGYDCFSSTDTFPGPTNGAQLFRLNSAMGTLTAEPGAFYPGICRAKADPTSQFVGASILNDPQNGFSGSDTFALFRLDSSSTRLVETDRVMFPMLTNGIRRDVASIAFDHNAEFVYVSFPTREFAAFRIDRSSGKLTPIIGLTSTPATYLPLFVVGRK